MVRTVPSEVIDAALQIIDMAKAELDCELNPNVVLTLADHLQFAVERLKDGCVIENPLSDTVEFVYPVEHGLGLRTLAILEKETGVSMPRTEACYIAMHLVNSESADGRVDDMDEVMRTLSSIDEVANIVEREFNITVDRASYNYARFTTHLRYLIKMLKADKASSDFKIGCMIAYMANYPYSRNPAASLHVSRRWTRVIIIAATFGSAANILTLPRGYGINMALSSMLPQGIWRTLQAAPSISTASAIT